MLWPIATASWIACGIAAAIIGAQRNASGVGLLLGIFLGPIGVIAAFALDGRHKCPFCGHRVDAEVAICAVCRENIVWYGEEPLDPKDLNLRLENAKREAQRRAQVAAREEERIREQQKRNIEQLRKTAKYIIAALAAILRSISSPFISALGRVNKLFEILSGEVLFVLRLYQLLLYVVTPLVFVWLMTQGARHPNAERDAEALDPIAEAVHRADGKGDKEKEAAEQARPVAVEAINPQPENELLPDELRKPDKENIPDRNRQIAEKDNGDGPGNRVKVVPDIDFAPPAIPNKGPQEDGGALHGEAAAEPQEQKQPRPQMVQESLPGEARKLPPDELAAAKAAKQSAIDNKKSEILAASKKLHAIQMAARAATVRRANGIYNGAGPEDLERQADQSLQLLSAMRRELATIKRTPVENFAPGGANIVGDNPFESTQ